MTWYVYALRSSVRNYIYVGLTSNLSKRIKQHIEGKERTTRPYRPFELVLCEIFDTRGEARKREVYLKSGVGKELIRRLTT